MKSYEETRRRIRRTGHSLKTFASYAGIPVEHVYKITSGHYLSDEKTKYLFNALYLLELSRKNALISK